MNFARDAEEEDEESDENSLMKQIFHSKSTSPSPAFRADHVTRDAPLDVPEASLRPSLHVPEQSFSKTRLYVSINGYRDPAQIDEILKEARTFGKCDFVGNPKHPLEKSGNHFVFLQFARESDASLAETRMNNSDLQSGGRVVVKFAKENAHASSRPAHECKAAAAAPMRNGSSSANWRQYAESQQQQQQQQQQRPSKKPSVQPYKPPAARHAPSAPAAAVGADHSLRALFEEVFGSHSHAPTIGRGGSSIGRGVPLIGRGAARISRGTSSGSGADSNGVDQI